MKNILIFPLCLLHLASFSRGPRDEHCSPSLPPQRTRERVQKQQLEIKVQILAPTVRGTAQH